jgi:hypothetical protein
VNGFNEDYEHPGIGEDTDLQWRLEKSNFIITDAKFLATLFHLHHERRYGLSEQNLKILRLAQEEGQLVTKNGLLRP